MLMTLTGRHRPCEKRADHVLLGISVIGSGR